MSDVFLPQFLKQTAVYWPLKGSDAGRAVYDEPVEVKCRWEDRQVEYLDSHGDRTVSHSVVMVDRDMTLGGSLWLGTLESSQDPDDPSGNPGSIVIMAFNKVPTENAKKFVRKAIG